MSNQWGIFSITKLDNWITQVSCRTAGWFRNLHWLIQLSTFACNGEGPGYLLSESWDTCSSSYFMNGQPASGWNVDLWYLLKVATKIREVPRSNGLASCGFVASVDVRVERSMGLNTEFPKIQYREALEIELYSRMDWMVFFPPGVPILVPFSG
jgi:hypothetical protein